MRSLVDRLSAPSKLRSIYTPLSLVVTAVMLAYAASVLSEQPHHALWRIVAFALVSIIALHMTMYVFRWATDKLSLKLIDYLYLTIALTSIGVVIDIQSALIRLETFDFMPRHIEKLEEIRKFCSDDFEVAKVEGDVPQRNVPCKWQDEILEYVRGGGYVHNVIRTKIQSFDSAPDQHRKHAAFFVELKNAYRSMELLYEGYGVDPNEYNHATWKLFFVYLLCIGGVMRIAKVTVEVFDWQAKQPVIDVAT